MKQLNEYTEKLEKLYMTVRKEQHDYFNTLISMIRYIDENDMQGLQTYIKSKVLLSNFQNPVVKGLLSRK